MTARKYEIKKQVVGEDAEHEKSGRILNRVIKWERGEITVEADPNVSETHKAFLPKQPNFVVTPCVVGRRGGKNMRDDGTKGQQAQNLDDQ